MWTPHLAPIARFLDRDEESLSPLYCQVYLAAAASPDRSRVQLVGWVVRHDSPFRGFEMPDFPFRPQTELLRIVELVRGRK